VAGRRAHARALVSDQVVGDAVERTEVVHGSSTPSGDVQVGD
jgi:hypothetical protein